MPFFEQNPLQQLTIQPGEADTELDLRGLANEPAMAAVNDLLARSEMRGTCLIRFTAATNDGQETLFLPLGRRLLQARRDGRLNRCLPTSDGAGYFIEFSTGKA